MTIETLCLNKKNPIGITDPVFFWKITDCDDAFQKAYRVVVFNTEGIKWDSGIVESSDSVYVSYDGPELEENTKYFWNVTVITEKYSITSVDAFFITGIFKTETVTWISPPIDINSPLIYKAFEVNEISEYSTVNVCGLGFFELYINGEKVSKDIMNPVRTDYDTVIYRNLKYPYENKTKKSVQYLTYEVSKYLKKGKNTVCLWLGNGWYRQQERIVEGTFDYGNELKMFFRLTNGKEILNSDESWLCVESPIVYDNLFYGELYDARIKHPSLGEGTPAHFSKVPETILVPQLCPGERITETFSPVELKNGVYDAGKCMSGFAEIVCHGKSGDEVTIYFSEQLDENGDLDYKSTAGYEETDRCQIQVDTYILNGKGQEIYRPRFVWHAFRYFKICTSENVKIETVKLHYVCTNIKPALEFECSQKTLNDFHKISVNTALSNLHGCVPMDCPHRERLGYTGDGELSSLSVMYSFDAKLAYEKWFDDSLDAQNQESGFVPHTAPFNGGGGGPAWGSAIAIVAWNLYMQYGDKKIIFKALPAIKKWLKYLSSKTEGGLVTHEEGGSWCLGDWCMPSKYPWSEPHLDEIKIPSELVNSVYYIYCINLYEEMLKIAGEDEDYEFANERKCVADSINAKFLKEEYLCGEQGANIFPLFVEIVPDTHKKVILEKSVQYIEKNGYCFDTGISGTKFLFCVLNRYGRNDIALKMLLNDEYPSFGYMLKNGATALWETWEGNGSKNHTAFLSGDSWLTYGLAGINPLGGYKEFCIKPYFAKEIDFLKVSLQCEYGTISLDWVRRDDVIEVEITVPFNTTAHVNLNGRCFDLKAGKHKEVIV